MTRWIRHKYTGKARLGMPEFRRRFCDIGWRITHQDIEDESTLPRTVGR